MQQAQLKEQNEEQAQQIRQLQQQLQTLRQELQTKSQQLQDSQRCMHTLEKELSDSQESVQLLRQELQDSQRQNKQPTYQVKEEQCTIDDRDTQLQTSEQVTADLEFQRDLPQHVQTNKKPQDTVRQLGQDLQQVVKEKQASERQPQELNQQMQTMKPSGIQAQPRQELQLTQQMEKKLHATEVQNRQLQKQTQQPQRRKRVAKQSQKAQAQQKAILIRRLYWKKESTAPERMSRGSAASDSNMAYFNCRGSTKVQCYSSRTRKWCQLPDTPHTHFALAVVQHTLIMIGGSLGPGKATNSILSITGMGKHKKWRPLLPAMHTKRYDTAVVCGVCSLIVAGGRNGLIRLTTVEVLDTDTQQWSIASLLPHPFSLATSTICGERLYMLGGYDQPGNYGTHSVLTCAISELLQSCQPQLLAGTAPDSQSTIWQRVADASHYFSSCATLCGQLVAVGGWDEDDTRAVNVYNDRTDSWEASIARDMPTARRRPVVVILNGKMMVVGGRVGGFVGWTETNEVEILY